MSIRFFSNRDIDRVAWDACVEAAPVSLAYANSWYLDAVCDGAWNALVLDDYRAVMPLPYRRKWGIDYLSQPAFTQQLGVFGLVSAEEYRQFLHAIPRNYWLADLQLHTGTPANLHGLKARTTYWLNLERPYETIYAGYSKDARKNLRNLETHSGPTAVTDCFDFDLHIANYRAAYGAMNPNLDNEAYRRFLDAMEAAAARQKLEALQINDCKGTPLAMGIFLKSRQLLHYVMGAPVQGADSGGVHGIIDALIRRYAGSPFTLDFEGSEIPSVAYFYAKFGALPQHYYALHINRLPCLLRLLKK